VAEDSQHLTRLFVKHGRPTVARLKPVVTLSFDVPGGGLLSKSGGFENDLVSEAARDRAEKVLLSNLLEANDKDWTVGLMDTNGM
jgi:hypothetical protein